MRDNSSHSFSAALCFLLFCLYMAGCVSQVPTGALAFTTLEQKQDAAYIGQQQFNALEPGLVVIFNEETALEQGDLFSESARLQLRGLNWQTHFALAVFQGWKPSDGYGVEISEMALEEGQIVIRAEFRQPGAASDSEGAVTSPYHLVLVRRLAFEPEKLVFRLVVAGEELAVFPGPAP